MSYFMFRKIILSLCLSLPHVTSAENLALTSKELIDLVFLHIEAKNYFKHAEDVLKNKNLENIETLKEEKEKLHKILESVDIPGYFVYNISTKREISS